jgi:DNA-binding PadR family transcriptional regulator
MVVLEQEEKRQRRDVLRGRGPAESAEESQSGRMKTSRRTELTTPDLVLLSLLAERPMHGYQANAELERRCVRDWAGISRPQIYYSLEKLARAGMIRSAATREPAAGPERQEYETTAKGRAALAAALEREEWTTQRERPPFLTWMALSWQARPGIFEEQMARRKEFLKREIAREKATLDAVMTEVGHPYHEAVWMITLMSEQLETELRWLEKVAREISKRGQAKRPAYAPSE